SLTEDFTGFLYDGATVWSNGSSDPASAPAGAVALEAGADLSELGALDLSGFDLGGLDLSGVTLASGSSPTPRSSA
ncbi:MAG: hypothetical protein IIC73_09045, partial [Armatimonadetes bacterium]|nr:hypothetical protein [Armatimonadota bacterium]